MINQSLAAWSDTAFEWALAGYIAALVCFGIEFASRKAVVPTEAEAASARLKTQEKSLRKGGTTVLDPPVVEAGSEADSIGLVRRADGKVPLGTRFGWAGMVVLLLGFVGHVVSIVLRGLATGRAPWGNMYEFASLICAAAVAGFLVLLWRTKQRVLGFFLLLPVVILMYVAQSVLYAEAGVLVPALHSYWLVIHVLSIALSCGVLMLSGVASTTYLLRARYEKRLASAQAWTAEHGADPQGRVAVDTRSIWSSLPSLSTLDKWAYRTAIVAFPVFTFAVIAGAMWAEVAWGRYWGWDPKETFSFVSWVLYAAYLHARSTAGWRGTKSAWISVIAFLSMIFNLFFVNMVVAGLHSYAGLN